MFFGKERPKAIQWVWVSMLMNITPGVMYLQCQLWMGHHQFPKIFKRVTKKLKRFIVQEVFACLALSDPKTETVMCLLCYLYLSSKPEAQCQLSEEARKYCLKLLPCERVLKWCPFRRLSFSLHPAGCENPLLPFHVTFGYLCPALKSSTLESPALDISFC